MEGFWPIFFLLVVLKIPVFGALWLVWWASKAPEQETTGEDSDGGFKRHRPFPTRPRGPHHSPSGTSAIGRQRGPQNARQEPRLSVLGRGTRPLPHTR